MGFDAKYVQRGEAVDYLATAVVSAGGIVIQGGLVGVAKTDIASGATGAIATCGVYDVVKDSAVAVSAGATVYWNATSGYATTVSSGGVVIGKAIEAVTSSTETVRVLLNA